MSAPPSGVYRSPVLNSNGDVANDSHSHGALYFTETELQAGACTSATEKQYGVDTDGSPLCASDNNTTYTAGDHLTLDGTEFDVDSELATDTIGPAYIEDPDTEDFDEIFYFGTAVVVTRVWCMTDTGTATLNIENAAGSDVLSSDIVCDDGGQTSCASGCDVNTINTSNDNFAQYADGNISISATASTPGKVSVALVVTKDD